MSWRITDPKHLLGAMRVSLAQGGRFLTGRIHPLGPALGEPSVSFVHKASWGMYAAGVDHAVLGRMLDWIQENALQPSGDFYLPEERPEYKDFQRVYRPAIFGRVATWIGHPVIEQPKVIDRILQYQHEPSGGAFHFIGDDPDAPEFPPTIGTLNTTFFGHLMIALDIRDRAISVGEWVRRWVELNRDHLGAGRMYTAMTLEGELVTDVEPVGEISKIVANDRPRQEFWNGGTAMAYLVDLYEVMRTRWDYPEAKARPYLDAALALLEFEKTMPLDTYLWPSKCKVGWGAGELLRVLVERGLEGPEMIEDAYRVAERVAVFTFMDNQLADGGWPSMHYPLSDDTAALGYTYKPLKSTVWVPAERIDDPQTIWLPREEISGEFLAEMKSVERGVTAWLAASGETLAPNV